jgi:hypothetical protein
VSSGAAVKAPIAARALLAALHGTEAAGSIVDGDIDLGDGLVAHVAIEVRRNPGSAERARLRRVALEWLENHPYEALRCQGGKERTCSRLPHQAVLYQSRLGDTELVLVACTQHAERHTLRPEAVLGTVELLEQELAPLRKRAEKDRAERRAEEDRKEAEERARMDAELDRIVRANPGRTARELADLAYSARALLWSGEDRMGRTLVAERAHKLGVPLAPSDDSYVVRPGTLR